MITKTDFDTIYNVTELSVIKTLNFIKENRSNDAYVLILAEADFNAKVEGMGLNPFVIDSFVDKRKDNTRLDYAMDFLNDNYSFEHTDTVEDKLRRIHEELMIYTHVWESKPFLKKLYQVGQVALTDQFVWIVEIPETGKSKFINEKIIKSHRDVGSPLAEIIENGFHRSIRNAFAHSEYVLNAEEKYIKLNNYKGKPYELDRVSFNDWTRRFAYSVILNYHFLNEIHKRRISLVQDFGTDTFSMIMPVSRTEERVMTIVYNQEQDSFIFNL